MSVSAAVFISEKNICKEPKKFLEEKKKKKKNSVGKLRLRNFKTNGDPTIIII